MKADHSITVPTAGGTDPDPIAAPATVPNDKLIGITPYARPSDRVAVMKELVLALAAPAADSVTVSVYAVDDETKPPAGPDANTIFYPIATGVVVGGQATPVRVTGMSGLEGSVYIRVTAKTVAADRQLRVIGAET